MGRSRVRRLRAVQGKYNADDADSNESYGRMPLGANERASERLSVASFLIGKIATWGAIARAHLSVSCAIDSLARFEVSC